MTDETKNGFSGEFENENEQDFSQGEDCACESSESLQNETVYEAVNDFSVTNEAEQKDMDFSGGVAYTKNDDGNITNGYEWTSGTYPVQNVSAYEHVGNTKNSGRGFRTFLTIVLSVFTLSVLTVTGMVAKYIYDSDNSAKTVYKSSQTSSDVQNSENFDYNGTKFNNENYVSYDFAEHNEGEALSIPEVAAKCSPSCVGIISEVEVSTSPYYYYFGGSSKTAQASGSGFVYSADGYIITNHHVIEDATKVTVILLDGTQYEAEIVGSDSLSDIAVLKIDPSEDTPLIPLEIGNSDELVVGESVVAIGCPAGIDFIGTVTDGIVSAINRNVEVTDDYGNFQKTMTLIQTNATINHGNSGGPLINNRGQVIGINTLKLSSDYEGIGFSIPINGAVTVISQLIEHGEVVERTDDDYAYGKGMIGINGSAISKSESEYYDIPEGVLVVQIDRDSSAAKAGLKRGDIITHYNGKQVKSVDDINNEKGSARAGTEVTLTVYRDDGTVDITFKLDAQS